MKNKNKSNDKLKKDFQKTKDEIDQLQTEIGELKIGWQRTQADFENFRNRTGKEKAELIKYANADLIEQILPVIDNFERALEHKPKELEDNEYLKGLEYTKIQLEQILEANGVEKINIKSGDKFDPNIAEATEATTSEKYQSDHVIKVVLSGYKMGDKVLRPAKVIVAE